VLGGGESFTKSGGESGEEMLVEVQSNASDGWNLGRSFEMMDGKEGRSGGRGGVGVSVRDSQAKKLKKKPNENDKLILR
jgi:hypothetical protein